MRYGVPQSSDLGPLLFFLYTADINKTVEQHEMSSHLYADDSKLYFYSRPGDTQSSEKQGSSAYPILNCGCHTIVFV